MMSASMFGEVVDAEASTHEAEAARATRLDGEEPRLGPGQVERQRSAKREGSLEGNDVDAHTGMVGFAARGMTGG